MSPLTHFKYRFVDEIPKPRIHTCPFQGAAELLVDYIFSLSLWSCASLHLVILHQNFQKQDKSLHCSLKFKMHQYL